MRRWRRAGWFLLGLLALAGGLTLALRSPWTGDWLARLLAARLEVATGERASVGSVRLEPWRARVEG